MPANLSAIASASKQFQTIHLVILLHSPLMLVSLLCLGNQFWMRKLFIKKKFSNGKIKITQACLHLMM